MNDLVTGPTRRNLNAWHGQASGAGGDREVSSSAAAVAAAQPAAPGAELRPASTSPDRERPGAARRRLTVAEVDVRQVMRRLAGRSNRVLIVDDQQEIHDDFVEILCPRAAQASNGLAAASVGPRRPPHDRRAPDRLPEVELLHARTGEEALDIVRRGRDAGSPVAAAYVDIRMPPGMDGMETIRGIHAMDADVQLVIMTGYTGTPLSQIVSDVDLLHKLLYIRKPFAREEIQQMTRSLVEKWNVDWELAEKRRQLVESHRRLETVLDATGDPIAMYDVGGRLVFANRWYEELVGATEGELRRMSSQEVAAHFSQRFREPRMEDTEHRFLVANGHNVLQPVDSESAPEQRLFQRTSMPVCGDGDAVIGDLHVYRDVSKEIEADRMKAEVVRLRGELETTYSVAGMVGSSAEMQRVYWLMKHAVESDITVLVRGESGTGKELVAKSLHYNSPRRSGPLLVVNCAAVPEGLVESELFGHEQGAFTGATRRRIGSFERAAGGTILLDEVGDMPLPLQGKLLRVLQEREIRRVGGAADIPVDVRVVAATNKNLEEAMRAGAFREDLYFRLAAFPIVVPPLRERREDIPLLARHLLRKHADRAEKAISGISTAALRLLLQYAWPGNVRELENVIERALLMETTDVLQAASLPWHLWPGVVAGGEQSELLPLEEVVRRALKHALASTDSVTAAARELGINRATMYRKLKRYDLAATR